jgi:heat shock protein HtpX
MIRILLFLATNVAIMVVVSIVFSLLGLTGTLDAQGITLDLNSLLLMSAIIGMAGSFISLALSKWTAKQMLGVRIIKQPQNLTERWLVDLVGRYAQQAGIALPEVGIFESPDCDRNEPK